MFEFEDEKIGRVKVVNVTEARSSMATIMGDKETNYIVTKNNKPIRVVVSYETFKKAISTINPTAARSAGNKTPELKDGLKGLIQSKEKDLKHQEAIATKGRSTSAIIPKPDPEVVEVVEQVPAMELPVIELQDTGTDDSQPSWASQMFAEPTSSPDFPSTSATTTSTTATATTEISAPPTVEPVIPYVTVNTPPPNGDYFNRFKKLYEAPRYDSLFQKTVSLPSEGAPSSTVMSSPIESSESPITASVRTVPVQTASSSANISADRSATTPPTPNRRPNSAREGASNLPSIQDLLSELEQEKLSGEDENGLSPNQVNQLLNRINK